MKQYKHRIADILLRDRLEETGAVLIEGPKWCGKTTTAEQQAKSVLYVADPEKQGMYREMADLQVKMLLQGEAPRLIDEWQIIPRYGTPSASRWTTEARRGSLSSRGRPCPPRPTRSTTRARDVLPG